MALRLSDRVPWAAKWAAAVAVGLAASTGAYGFYFKGWPGDSLPRERTLIPPGTPSEANPPSSRISTDQENPRWHEGDTPPGTIEQPPPHPHGTPEPATAVLAGVGLAAVGLAWRRHKRAEVK